MEVQFVSSFKERMNKGGMLSNNFLPMAEMMMALPGTRSATTLMKQLLLPRTWRV
jgi:hypothetical protein